jgi:hypothetical protein
MDGRDEPRYFLAAVPAQASFRRCMSLTLSMTRINIIQRLMALQQQQQCKCWRQHGQWVVRFKIIVIAGKRINSSGIRRVGGSAPRWKNGRSILKRKNMFM